MLFKWYMSKKKSTPLKGIKKVPTGIEGFDQITYGGIPYGRPTLVCGNTGCGKTLFGMEILINGAIKYNEPGLFIAFEETPDDLVKNVASLGFDLNELQRKNLIYIDYISVDSQGYANSGEYDLEGLFIRLENAVKKINAKRVVIDTLEVLFTGFDSHILRKELKRLFQWLKDKNLTTVVTAEKGKGALTRHGIEEYVADCVISLSHHLMGGISTRHLEIVKYRGSFHETNEFPFLIGKKGISILPITTVEMKSTAPSLRISTGIAELDQVLGGKGYFEGSSILISGSSGSGKTTFAASFAHCICKQKKKCLFFSYEESESEILRNFKSIGNDLTEEHAKGYFKVSSTRPTQWGLEKHLGQFIDEIEHFKPHAVIVDPVSTLAHCGNVNEVYTTLIRMIDFLKSRNITLLMTLLYVSDVQEYSFGIASIIDTWILLRNLETQGELFRELLVVKSRGINHSNRVRQFNLSENGVTISNPYHSRSNASQL